MSLLTAHSVLAGTNAFADLDELGAQIGPVTRQLRTKHGSPSDLAGISVANAILEHKRNLSPYPWLQN